MKRFVCFLDHNCARPAYGSALVLSYLAASIMLLAFLGSPAVAQLPDPSGSHGTVRAERVGLSLEKANRTSETTEQDSQTISRVTEQVRGTLSLDVRGLLMSQGDFFLQRVATGSFQRDFDPHFLSVPTLPVIHFPSIPRLAMPASKSLTLKIKPMASLATRRRVGLPHFPDVQSFHPQDFQRSLANFNFGRPANGVGRMIGMRLVIEKK